MRTKLFAALLLSFVFIGPSAPAFACPAGQSRGAFGWCYPNIGGSVGKEAERIKNEVRGQLGGHPLAVYLQQSRDSARPTSSPVPFHIQQALAGFVRQDVLNRARYKVGDHGLLNAAAAALGTDANVAAVALVDVIVFRHGSDAQQNLPLWVHELTHVRQFADWGVRDFGIRYARNKGAVEGEANGEENRFIQLAGNRTNPQPQQMPFPVPMPAAACYTPMGSCMMSVAIPRGASCYCPTYSGPVWGQAN